MKNGAQKRITLAAYEKHAETYAQGTADYFEKVPAARVMRGAFTALLNGSRILDLGCGPGRDLAWFRELGLDPVGADLSHEMMRQVRNRGLCAFRMDFEHLGFRDQVFDGVWAFHSLQHGTKKNLPAVLRDLWRILKPNAPLLVSFIEGKGAEWRKSERFAGCARYFAMYQEDELKKLLKRCGFYVVAVLRPEPLWLNILALRLPEKS